MLDFKGVCHSLRKDAGLRICGFDRAIQRPFRVFCSWLPASDPVHLLGYDFTIFTWYLNSPAPPGANTRCHGYLMKQMGNVPSDFTYANQSQGP